MRLVWPTDYTLDRNYHMLNWLRSQLRPQVSTVSKQTPPDYSEAQKELIEKLSRYIWYHTIEVAEGIRTYSVKAGFQPLWQFILKNMSGVVFEGKRVLDVGCRDGLFSFEAERSGASEVIGIDNDLSKGAVEFLIPYFNSKVRMEKLNLYDLRPEIYGEFDIVCFFGVLYHLRYPFWGLKKIADCVKTGGLLLIESGALSDTLSTQHSDMLFCPVENSPYEVTSCTFFNRQGLTTTMRSLGFELFKHDVLDSVSVSPDKKHKVNRQFFHFRNVAIPKEASPLYDYWDKTHTIHTVKDFRD